MRLITMRWLILVTSLLKLISSGFPFHSIELYAQTYPFRHYSTANGLVHSDVRSIYQDTRGYLWFGTEGGLNRYDGSTFQEYLSGGAHKSAVYAIHESDDGTLWFGTYGNGLAMVRPRDTSFTWLTEQSGALPGNTVTALLEDRGQNLWIGTDNGICVYRSDGRQQRYHDEFPGLGEIYGIAREPDGTLWVAAHSGLFRCTINSSWGLTSAKVLDKSTRSVLLCKDGSVVAGTSGGGNDRFGIVCRVTPAGIDTLVSYQTAGKLIKAESLFEDADSTLWVGTGYGVYLLRDGRVTHLDTDNGLWDENIYTITQDREGTMWFGTGNGVMKLGTPRFLNYGMREGLSSYVILAMLEDYKKNIWLGLYNSLTRLDLNGGITTWDETTGLVHHTVRSIAEDQSGQIWVSTPLGVSVISSTGVHTTGIAELGQGMDVWNICPANDGGYWFGAHGGLFKVRNEKVVSTISSGLLRGVAQPLLVDRSGTLWFTDRGPGLRFLKDGKLDSLMVNDGLRRIHCAFEDRVGVIWIGSDGGCTRLVNGSLTTPPFSHPSLDSSAVYLIMQDSLDHLWFGTEHGAFEWTGTVLHQFSAADGMAADVVQAGLVAKNGEVWFGTRGGVSRLDRASRAHRVPIPDVLITSVSGNDGPIADPTDINYDNHSLVFAFNALSFVNESAMRFQWMVRGFDRDWLSPQFHREVRYTNLPPGAYVFAVRAANRNGEWSSPVKFPFAISPPFWQKWWFIVLCIAGVVSLLTLAYQYRVSQLLKIERIRRRIAADLHDDIASSLASVAIYSDVIQKQLPGATGEVGELLVRIRDLSREVMENIGLTVWAVDPRKDQLGEVFQYFQRYATQLCAARGIAFQGRMPAGARPLALLPDNRRTLFLILKEGLNNIVRHSGCTTVDFSCAQVNNTLELTLLDNGKGFSSDSASDGHGLSNMLARATSIGASLNIESAPGKGTVLRLKMRMA